MTTGRDDRLRLRICRVLFQCMTKAQSIGWCGVEPRKGNEGLNVALLLAEKECEIVGVSDISGELHDEPALM
ncbi:MAG: hypothetical protein IIB09_08740 [Bacteroidetes bacterium]|nr:hypothetical protein [Bacteroidota bacterium]